LGSLKERDDSEDLGVDGRIILILMWIGFIWLRTGAGGGLL
jgi:hypothetical protein